MTYLDKQKFLAWACDEPLANTTRGVLAEYIVAKALGTLDTKRVEWDKYDLRVDGIGVEVKIGCLRAIVRRSERRRWT